MHTLEPNYPKFTPTALKKEKEKNGAQNLRLKNLEWFAGLGWVWVLQA